MKAEAVQHWENVYRTKAADAVSWYTPHLSRSLDLIRRAASGSDRVILDVGGGESTLVDDLVDEGYTAVHVLDISQTAIDVTRSRLGPSSDSVTWWVGDVTQVDLPTRTFDVWHDRAVFHFLTSAADRSAYVAQVARAVKPGGHIIVATFGAQGPTQCSGLDVVRYEAETLHGEFGPKFTLIESAEEVHETPWGATQQFLYCYCVLG